MVTNQLALMAISLQVERSMNQSCTQTFQWLVLTRVRRGGRAGADKTQGRVWGKQQGDDDCDVKQLMYMVLQCMEWQLKLMSKSNLSEGERPWK